MGVLNRALPDTARPVPLKFKAAPPTVNVAARVPAAVGKKRTVRAQDAFAAILLPEVRGKHRLFRAVMDSAATEGRQPLY